MLTAHFHRIPTEDDIEAIQVVETEIFCDFVDEFETRTEIELVQRFTAPVLLPSGVPYQIPSPEA